MSVRAIIYDCDGMVNRERRFSERLASRIPLEKTLAFFSGDFQRCLIGDLDLKVALEAHFKSWGWTDGVDAFLDLWFDDDANTIDLSMLVEIDRLRALGIRAYLATNNETYRVEYLLNTRGLGPHFDAVFSSAALHSKKPQPGFYEAIFSSIPERRDEVLYWDDDEKYINFAKEYGLRAELYSDLHSFKKTLESLI